MRQRHSVILSFDLIKSLKFNELDYSNLLFRPTEFYFHSGSSAMAETNE